MKWIIKLRVFRHDGRIEMNDEAVYSLRAWFAVDDGANTSTLNQP